MSLQLIEHAAEAINAAPSSGRLRGVAGVVGHAVWSTPPHLQLPATDHIIPGRVTSAGTWQSEPVHNALALALGPQLAQALRPTFEWYVCRGAFFHNDAHFDDVLFGVWCVQGPAANIVFPRAALRLDAAPGTLVVFDPFEVHGVLAPYRTAYDSADYVNAAASIFIGFELELTAAVAAAFRVLPPSDARTLSSGTRVSASTGAFD